jgi:uncharacterized membrane protein
MLDIIKFNWVTLAALSAILFGLGDYIVVFSEQRKMDVITLYITYTVLIGLVNLIYLVFFHKNAKDVLKFGSTEWAIVAGLCVCYFLAYMLHFVALQKAPNPGYANALVMFHVVILTALSVIYLKKPVNLPSVIGIALMFVGGWLLTVYAGA